MRGVAVCDGRPSGPAVSIVVLSWSTSKDEVKGLSTRKSATGTVSFGKTPSCAIPLQKRSDLAINSAAVIPPNHLPFAVVHFFRSSFPSTAFVFSFSRPPPHLLARHFCQRSLAGLLMFWYGRQQNIKEPTMPECRHYRRTVLQGDADDFHAFEKKGVLRNE